MLKLDKYLRYCRFVLAGWLVAGALISSWNSRPCEAQTAPRENVRKLYVPSEIPEDWPDGDWRPFATEKYFRLTNPQLAGSRRSPLQDRVDYQAVWSNEGTIAGTFQLKLRAGRDFNQWISLGAPDHAVTSFQSGEEKLLWGTGAEGELLIRPDETAETLQGNWQASQSAAKVPQSWSIQLIRAAQKNFSLELPNHLVLVLPPGSRQFLTVEQVDANRRRWKVRGLENSLLKFSVQLAPREYHGPVLVARCSHLISLSPESSTFAMTCEVDQIDADSPLLNVSMPAGFRPDTVLLNQIELTSWKLIAENDKRTLQIAWPNPELAQPRQIMISGLISAAASQRWESAIPQIADAVNHEQLVSLVINHPLGLKQISTSDLKQQEIRYDAGNRDILTFLVSGADPRFNLMTEFAIPVLSVRQLVAASLSEREVSVDQWMQWQVDRPGLFGSTFLVSQGYDVASVVAYLKGEEIKGVNWNVTTTDKKQLLAIQLPNELLTDAVMLVRVRLKSRNLRTGMPRVSFPVLRPDEAVLKQSLLAQNNLTVERWLPASQTPDASSGIQKSVWDAFRPSNTSTFPFRLPPLEELVDITTARRVVAVFSDEQSSSLQSAVDEEINTRIKTTVQQTPQGYQVHYEFELRPEYFTDQQQFRFSLAALPEEDFAPATFQWKISEAAESHQFRIYPTDNNAEQNSLSFQCFWSGGVNEATPFRWTTSLLLPRRKATVEKATDSATELPVQMPLPKIVDSSAVTCQASLHWNSNEVQLAPVAGETDADADASGQRMLAYDPQSPPDILVRNPSTQSQTAFAKPAQGQIDLFSLWDVQTELPHQFEWIYQTQQPLSFPAGWVIEFAQPVYWHEVVVNGEVFTVNKTDAGWKLPQLFSEVRSLRVRYSSGSEESIPLPTTILPVVSTRFHCCVPNSNQLFPTGQIPVWYPNPELGLDMQQMSQSPLALNIERLLQSGDYRLYTAQTAIPVRNSLPLKIKMTVVNRQHSWLLLLVSLITSLYLGVRKRVHPLLQLMTPVLLVLGMLFFAGPAVFAWLTPVAGGLLVAFPLVQPARYLWKHQMKVSRESHPEDRINLFRLLFSGSVSSMLLFLLHGPAWAQPNAISDVRAGQGYEMLIPLEGSLLDQNFQGIPEEEYPSVIYLPVEVSDGLNALQRQAEVAEPLIFLSADYTWERLLSEPSYLHCRYQVNLAPGFSSTRLFLPIKNFSSLRTLKAKVNGIIEPLTPLPDGSGIEVDISDPSLQQIVSESQDIKLDLELDVVPRQIDAAGASSWQIKLPPCHQARLNVPANPNSTTVDVVRADSRRTVFPGKGIQLTPSSSLQLAEVGGSIVDNSESPAARLNGQYLLVHRPGYLEMSCHLELTFPPETDHRINCRIPEGMILRQVSGPSSFQQTMLNSESGSICQIVFPNRGQSNESLLFQFSLLNRMQGGVENLALPRFEFTEPIATQDQIWQIAVTTTDGWQLQNLKSPESTNQISREAFAASWPEELDKTRDFTAIQIETPSSVQWEAIPVSDVYQISGEHVLEPTTSELTLNSNFQGICTTGRLWRFAFQKNDLWDLSTVRLLSEQLPVNVKMLTYPDRWEFLAAEPVTGKFTLQVNWRYRPSLSDPQLTVTPPRPLGASSYQESIRILDSFLTADWAFTPSGNLQDSGSAPLRQMTWRSDEETPAPRNQIQRQFALAADPLTESQPQDAGDSGDSEFVPEQVSEQSASLPLTIEHFIRESPSGYVGQSLIIWPAEMLEFRTTVQIPESLKCSLNSIRNASIIQDDPREWTVVRSTETAADQREVAAFLLLDWSTEAYWPRLLSHQLKFPLVQTQATQHWTLFNSQSRTDAPQLSESSLNRLLNQFAQLGEGLDSVNLSSQITEGNQVEGRELPRWTEQWQDRFDELRPLNQQQTLAGIQTLPAVTTMATDWSNWKHLAATQQLEADQTEISFPLPNERYELAILILLSCWGVGAYWQFRSHMSFRRRHLFVLSLLIVGLLILKSNSV